MTGDYAIAWAVLLEARRIHQAAHRRLELIDVLTAKGAVDRVLRKPRELMLIWLSMRSVAVIPTSL
jgi:hypothetical protein